MWPEYGSTIDFSRWPLFDPWQRSKGHQVRAIFEPLNRWEGTKCGHYKNIHSAMNIAKTFTYGFYHDSTSLTKAHGGKTVLKVCMVVMLLPWQPSMLAIFSKIWLYITKLACCWKLVPGLGLLQHMSCTSETTGIFVQKRKVSGDHGNCCYGNQINIWFFQFYKKNYDITEGHYHTTGKLKICCHMEYWCILWNKKKIIIIGK